MIYRISERELYIDKKRNLSQSLLIVPSRVTKFTGINCMNYIHMNNLLLMKLV